MESICEQYCKYWSEHPEHSVEDWQSEVASHNTRKGYWEWVEGCIEGDSLDEDE